MSTEPIAFTLSAIAAARASGTVVVRGSAYTIHALSDAEHQAILEVFRMPRPPMVKPPNKGSLAPLEPDLRDPEYVTAANRWGRQTRAAQAAIALRAEGYPGVADPATFSAWAQRVVPQLQGQMHATEIERVVKAADALIEAAAIAFGGDDGSGN